MSSVVTRFAPSPTGYLHLGHAFSALTAWHAARDVGGRFLLRIEDIDIRRCKAEFTEAILVDLAWLGLDWDGEVRRQSRHFDDYGAALDRLGGMGLVYPCFCTRADIAAAQSAPHGPDGPLYPGTCRHRTPEERRQLMQAGTEFALRLDVEKAAAAAGPYRFHDALCGDVEGDPLLFGDVVIARKDTPTSYHLAVTVDDHLQGVTLVTRGEDLYPATHVHVLLQRLLDYATPRYAHHRLLTDADGRRFAKRDRSLTLRAMRESGVSAAEVRRQAGFV
ncbi:MAG: tRNA glutamyl-Q(34) synthetase GluQRS [Alphaproteobacteria bacterium]|nr:tRNA glutamyl-Q(34) synthetase GluQRS [Alphaproteobacteria bacterium]